MKTKNLQGQCFYQTVRLAILKNQDLSKSKNLKKARDSSYMYKNELDKIYFQHDMAYGNFKNLPRTAASDKILRVKALNIAKNMKYGRYQRGLVSMGYKFFDKMSSGNGFKSEILLNERSSDLAT